MSLALHNAAREGNVVELTKLLAQHASTQSRDKHSRSPLHLAAWAGQLECCKLLVAEGADKGAAAMDDTTALHFAAQKGHLEVVRFLLNEGVSVNGKTRKGMTALMFAAQSGKVDLVKLLLKRKADARSKNKAGKSAADVAKDAKVKEALQEAVLHAQQQTSMAESKASDSQQQPGESGTVGSSGRELDAVAIGPPEGPATSAQEGAIGPPEWTATSVQQRAIGPPERPAASAQQGAIGPPERPATSVQQEATHGEQDSQQHVRPDFAKRKRTTHADEIVEAPAQICSDTASNRSAKAQKVVLSFAEDDEEN